MFSLVLLLPTAYMGEIQSLPEVTRTYKRRNEAPHNALCLPFLLISGLVWSRSIDQGQENQALKHFYLTT